MRHLGVVVEEEERERKGRTRRLSSPPCQWPCSCSPCSVSLCWALCRADSRVHQAGRSLTLALLEPRLSTLTDVGTVPPTETPWSRPCFQSYSQSSL
jgi:hypothetical protein